MAVLPKGYGLNLTGKRKYNREKWCSSKAYSKSPAQLAGAQRGASLDLGIGLPDGAAIVSNVGHYAQEVMDPGMSFEGDEGFSLYTATQGEVTYRK